MASQYGRMKWPASHGANLEWCGLVVASAPAFAGEPFGGKAKCPFRPLEYGIESISGMCKCVSNSSGRPTVRFKNSPLNNASAIPKAIPPPASPRAILLRVLVTSMGGEGRWTALMLGILEGSNASSTRAFSKRCGEILVIRFVHLSLPLQFFNLRTQLRKLFGPLLNIAKPGLKHLDFCLRYRRGGPFEIPGCSFQIASFLIPSLLTSFVQSD